MSAEFWQVPAREPRMVAENKYEFSAKAKCPVDGVKITMAVRVITKCTIPVEELLEISKALTAEPIMQEPYTAALEKELVGRGYRDAFVTTIGTHSGVTITCMV